MSSSVSVGGQTPSDEAAIGVLVAGQVDCEVFACGGGRWWIEAYHHVATKPAH